MCLLARAREWQRCVVGFVAGPPARRTRHWCGTATTFMPPQWAAASARSASAAALQQLTFELESLGEKKEKTQSAAAALMPPSTLDGSLAHRRIVAG